MAASNMATITASIERSLKNCTLAHYQTISGSDSSSSAKGVVGAVESPPLEIASADPTLELNSQAALPLHWEQCLNLKTGEIYYINWTAGMKAREDPRRTPICCGGYHYDSEEDDCISYESVNSSFSSSSSSSATSESSRCSSIEPWIVNNNPIQQKEKQGSEKTESVNITSSSGNVLVVAGCKSCLMYHMVPKQHEICPKCYGQLMHFNRLNNGCC